jgi:hypothetical protein
VLIIADANAPPGDQDLVEYLEQLKGQLEQDFGCRVMISVHSVGRIIGPLP